MDRDVDGDDDDDDDDDKHGHINRLPWNDVTILNIEIIMGTKDVCWNDRGVCCFVFVIVTTI